MSKIIEAVYEGGVFKPNKKLSIPEESSVVIKVVKVRGHLTKKDIKEIKETLKELPKSRINFEKLEEKYHEGKMSD